MGLYDITSARGLPGLDIMFIMDTFHNSEDERIVSKTMLFLGRCLRTSTVIRSNPSAFFFVLNA